MLECHSLLLRPWTYSPASSVRRQTGPTARHVRAILEATDGQALGFAYRPVRPSWWQRWFSHPTLAVYEGPDESLLCIVQRFWGVPPVLEVYDADGRRVGRCQRMHIEDRLGRPLALLHWSEALSALQFMTPDGRELATLARSTDGTVLAFAPFLDSNPLTKMTLLAVALSKEQA